MNEICRHLISDVLRLPIAFPKGLDIPLTSTRQLVGCEFRNGFRITHPSDPRYVECNPIHIGQFAGSKEARIAAEVVGPFVAVRGTPYVDVWEAVRPQVVGISAWPVVPKGEEWKAGVCRRLGVGEAPAFWRRILSSVRSYADLEASFVGAIEALIDHVTTE